MLDSLSTRLADFNDEVELLEIIYPLNSPSFNWGIDSFLSEFQHTKTVLLGDDSVIYAFVCLRDLQTAWELSVLATRKEFQGQGMMEVLIREISNTYGQDRELWLEVHENNLAARNLYRKLGFKEGQKRPLYYSDGGAAILFTKASLSAQS